MAAPIGNKFWELRSKHGRDKLFNTPEILWEAACEYFEWCFENPWLKNERTESEKGTFYKSTPIERPLTKEGLTLYLDVNKQYFDDFKKTCSKDFSLVISRIEDVIYKQKFEGAAVGAFNASIIARDLGLKDHTDVTTKGNEINNRPQIIFTDESKGKPEISEDLED